MILAGEACREVLGMRLHSLQARRHSRDGGGVSNCFFGDSVRDFVASHSCVAGNLVGPHAPALCREALLDAQDGGGEAHVVGGIDVLGDSWNKLSII